MVQYNVLIGLNYPPDETRAEPGDILPDGFVPAKTIKSLLAAGAIEEIAEKTPSKTSTASAPTTTPTTPDKTATATPSSGSEVIL